MTMIGSEFASNAAKSKAAGDASSKAEEASGRATSSDPETHGKAAMAHYDAAWRHQDAGNATRASKHRAIAAVHSEKAEAGRRAQNFADQQTTAANALTHKAELARFGSDSKEARSEKQLHQDAAKAHKAAAAAHEAAGDKRQAAFHGERASAHADFADGLKK